MTIRWTFISLVGSFLFLSSPCFCEESSIDVLNAMIQFSELYLYGETSSHDTLLDGYLNHFGKLVKGQISEPKVEEFERLQSQSEKVAAFLVKLYKEFQNNREESYILIDLSKKLYSLCDEVQSVMEDGFKKMTYQYQFIYMLPYIQSRIRLYHAKTTLIALVGEQYPFIERAEMKEGYWNTLDFMFRKFDQNKLHNYMTSRGDQAEIILIKLTDTINQIGDYHKHELDESVLSLASKVMKRIRKKQKKIIHRLTEIHRDGDKHVKHIAEIQGYNIDQKNLNFERMVQACSIGELYQKGCKTEDIHLKISYFTDVLKLDPKVVGSYINRGTCYYELGQYDQALQDFNRAVQLDPENATVFYHRGLTLTKLNHYEDAIQDFNLAIQLDQEYEYAILNRGYCYSKQGLYEFAIHDFKKVIELSPNNASAYFNLGCAYWNLGQWKEVVNALEKCLEIDPTHQKAEAYLPKAKEALHPKPIRRTIIIKH